MRDFNLPSLAGARPRRQDDERRPGIVCTLGYWRGPELARALAAQDGFGIATFKVQEALLEVIVTDYRDGSNANVFASERELTIFPGFAASERFLADLLATVDAASSVEDVRDFEPVALSLAELV